MGDREQPNADDWTARRASVGTLRPEVVTQLIAAAEHVTEALGTSGSPRGECITPAACAARELEIALWERLFRTAALQVTAPSCPYPSAVPAVPGQPEAATTDLFDRLPKAYKRMRKEQLLGACDIGLGWVRAVQERYDAGDIAGANAEVRELIAWLEEAMEYEPDDRFVVMAYARALTLLGQIEEHRFTTTGTVSARLHAAVLYQAALFACDDAGLSANNTSRTTLRATIARVTTERLERDALDNQLRMVLQPGWKSPGHLDGLLASQISPSSPEAWNDAMVYARRQVAQIRQRIAELPGQERDAHLIDRSAVLELLGNGR
jgi:hypothetical protein